MQCTASSEQKEVGGCEKQAADRRCRATGRRQNRKSHLVLAREFDFLPKGNARQWRRGGGWGASAHTDLHIRKTTGCLWRIRGSRKWRAQIGKSVSKALGESCRWPRQAKAIETESNELKTSKFWLVGSWESREISGWLVSIWVWSSLIYWINSYGETINVCQAP